NRELVQERAALRHAWPRRRHPHPAHGLAGLGGGRPATMALRVGGGVLLAQERRQLLAGAVLGLLRRGRLVVGKLLSVVSHLLPNERVALLIGHRDKHHVCHADRASRRADSAGAARPCACAGFECAAKDSRWHPGTRRPIWSAPSWHEPCF